MALAGRKSISRLFQAARSPTRPPNKDDPVGGRVGERVARRCNIS
jgi:hypothetical protein